MSSMNSTPAHSYDANYTAEINSKMHVPDRISIFPGMEPSRENYVNLPPPPPVREKFEMNVPSRILVAGGNGHIGEKAMPLELKLSNIPSTRDDVCLEAPPQVIKLGEYNVPSVEEERALETTTLPKKRSIPNGMITQREAYSNRSESFEMSAEDIATLQKAMAKFHQRLMVIETELSTQKQKELVLYGVGAAYILFRAIYWLHRNW